MNKEGQELMNKLGRALRSMDEIIHTQKVINAMSKIQLMESNIQHTQLIQKQIKERQ